MPANLQIQNDAGTPITTVNYGAIEGNDYYEQKFIVKNIGTETATSVILLLERINASDGLDFALIALDSGGNPGAYQAGDISIGSMIAGAELAFWVKVTIPNGTTPAGNPRQVNFGVDYIST